jgi:hypothetical protein
MRSVPAKRCCASERATSCDEQDGRKKKGEGEVGERKWGVVVGWYRAGRRGRTHERGRGGGMNDRHNKSKKNVID